MWALWRLHGKVRHPHLNVWAAFWEGVRMMRIQKECILCFGRGSALGGTIEVIKPGAGRTKPYVHSDGRTKGEGPRGHDGCLMTLHWRPPSPTTAHALRAQPNLWVRAAAAAGATSSCGSQAIRTSARLGGVCAPQTKQRRGRARCRTSDS